MASPYPLQGIELIDCAKANAGQGIETAAHLCGYGKDLNRFQDALKQACDRIGVEIHTLSDLVTDQQVVLRDGGIEVAPDTPAEL
ncbi:MAG: hypothetical protein SFW36_21885 [Leptolyngbyaceae cyanobacterium bins.59]|nr:hypothetical protein [Leptolyngbyaceae cyanobacterium bins.59]